MEMLVTMLALTRSMTGQAIHLAARAIGISWRRRPHYVIMLQDIRGVEGAIGSINLDVTKGATGFGDSADHHLILGLMRTLSHPPSTAPCDYSLGIGAGVGAGRWWGRRKRALAVATPAMGPLHPWTPAKTRTERRLSVTGSGAIPSSAPSATTRTPQRAAPHMQATEARIEARVAAEAAAIIAGVEATRQSAERHQPFSHGDLAAI